MTVAIEDIARYLLLGRHAPDAALASRMSVMRDEACKAARPVRTWLRTTLDSAGPLRGWLEKSRALSRRLDGCHAAYVACGTLGAAFDSFQRRVSATSGADALIVQATGAALIEKWMDDAEDAIRAELFPGETLVTRYSPGYGDFTLSAQRELLEFIDAPRKVGVSLTDSLLMVPSKSVSAVIGVRQGGQEP